MSKDESLKLDLGDVEDCVDKVEDLLLRLESSSYDPRWAAIARTHFQNAFSAARSVVFKRNRKL